MNNWLVVGHPGSGKTSFSNNLASKKGLHLIELDDYVWDKNWKEVSDKELNKRITKQIDLANNKFVLEGVRVDKLSEDTMKKLNNVIILGIPFYRSFIRATRRNFKRIFTKERICGENHETILSFCYTFFVTIIKGRSRSRLFNKVANSVSGSKEIFRTNKSADEWLAVLFKE